MLQDVQSWLDQHGYVLEMEVARELMLHSRNVVQGDQCIDPVTGKLREIDVLCSWGDPTPAKDAYHSVQMVVECKNTTAPWVAFQDDLLSNGSFHA